ncbi:MAG: tetratricopeptide repeat protein [Xanthomonadales bacterium]|nr:tetratricopeptide repeat protein [Gammaproteobacteria bacterium]MBT8052634.1 tetratricopeptide repeat protein [Gammaproteobacteria bacterium]NND56607.1 tetratricopeptide repeat protein [Xanthomonadales bacterium]NNK52451.1 tetratricopeptide repeat protein [Xanthomonadales bacterium]
MTKRITLKTITAICLLIASCGGIGAVHAQSDLCGVKRDVGTKALDEITWKQLNAVYEDVAEEEYNEAYDTLQRLLGRAGRDTYLQAILNQALAQVEWSRENYLESLAYFEKAVELDALPDQTHFALMYQIAQLYFMQERYDEALDRLDLWFCKSPEDKITSAAYVLQASIYAEKEDYSGVLTAIDKAISMDEDPQESWYQLKLAAHYELEQYPQAAETLEVMIARWPDTKMYWTQLSQIYYRLKRNERSLAVMALAYRKSLLDKQSDLVYLSSLYSGLDVPFKAAEVLQKGIRDGIVESDKYHWTIVAESWYAAEELEQSLVAFEQAGRAAADGAIDLRRGFILIDMERWQAALDALDRALEKGGLDERKTGESYLLRGMAQFNLGNYDSASADWGRAGRYEKTRDAAQQWMNHLKEERRRRAS